MRELLNNQITAYDMGNGWRVDIVVSANEYGAWIYHDGYGVKDFMFGVDQNQTRFGDFCDLVRGNFEEYKALYAEEVMDGETGQTFTFNKVVPEYTGGNIWLFYGQLTSGEYFLVDDNGCIIVLDESPADFDVSLYDKWQEKHFVRWIEGQEQKAFLRSMLNRIASRIDKEGGYISDAEIGRYRRYWEVEV